MSGGEGMVLAAVLLDVAQCWVLLQNSQCQIDRLKHYPTLTRSMTDDLSRHYANKYKAETRLNELLYPVLGQKVAA